MLTKYLILRLNNIPSICNYAETNGNDKKQCGLILICGFIFLIVVLIIFGIIKDCIQQKKLIIKQYHTW